MNEAIAAVAEALGNTPTVCRKYYIHSGLIDAYLDGTLPQIFQRFRPSRAAIAIARRADSRPLSPPQLKLIA